MTKKFILLFTFIFLFFTSQTAFAQTTITNHPDSPHELTLQADKTQAVANGQDTITITATLKDRTSFEPLENPTQEYPPIANTQLILQVSGTGINLNQTNQLTDANGQIKAYLTATTAGEKKITVTDPSLNFNTYTTDYYQVSLNIAFSPPGTPTPIPTATPTLTPTPTPTLIPTPTPTPWQPEGMLKFDQQLSFYEIEPQRLRTNETAIIRVTLLDGNGNPVTDEIPYVAASDSGNTIIQPTVKVPSIAYFSSNKEGSKKITVTVGSVQIRIASEKEEYIHVWAGPPVPITSSLDISLDVPPKDKLIVTAHAAVPIYFYVPQGRQIDSVTAAVVCQTYFGLQKLLVPLSLNSKDGTQVFSGELRLDMVPGVNYDKECSLQVTMNPPEEPEEPEEPPIEIPIVPIDPYGIIYNTKTGEIVTGAIATLYELQNNNWIIWNGVALQQVNPQTTDETGLYSFFVYPGEYYLTVEKEGYESFQSEIIEVIEEPVKLDVYLNPKPEAKLWLWMIALLIPIGFVVIALFIWQRKRKGIKPSEIQPVELQPNAH